MKFALLFLFCLVFPVAVYAQKTNPTPPPFLMAIDDFFQIAGMGLFATGKIERGSVKTGDAIEIVGFKATKTATVSGIEMSRKMINEAKAGDSVSILLRGVEKTDIERGQVLAKPGTMKASTKFTARLNMATDAQGGRKTPFTPQARVQIMIRNANFSGVLTLPATKKALAAGETGIDVEIELTRLAAVEKGLVIELRDLGKTVASGTIVSFAQTK